MDKFVVKGPSKIKGVVSCSGSKNLALPLLAATLLFDKPVILKNLPNVRDVQTMLRLLKLLGSKIKLSKNKKIVKIFKGNKTKLFAPSWRVVAPEPVSSRSDFGVFQNFDLRCKTVYGVTFLCFLQKIFTVQNCLRGIY